MGRINKVHTRTVDDGTTGHADGSRVSKHAERIAAVGALDEASSFLGLAVLRSGERTRRALLRVQNDLFDVGADLCAPEGGKRARTLRTTAEQVEWVEAEIDAATSRLAPLTSFVLPGGTEAAALLHVARACARRAEREIGAMGAAETATPAAVRYVNRLSDLLFVLARMENDEGRADVLWQPGACREC